MDKFSELLKKNKNDIIKPVAVLLAICIVIPLALALTNKLTADRIAGLEKEKSKAAMQRLIEADEFELNSFSSENKFDYYTAKKSSEIIGYIFTTTAKGYGGEVSVMTAVNTDGSVKSVEILDVSNETPGLGQNAAKENFYSQFEGKSGNVTLLKNGADAQKQQVNAVTGATITSRGITNAVNEALERFAEVQSADNQKEVAESEE